MFKKIILVIGLVFSYNSELFSSACNNNDEFQDKTNQCTAFCCMVCVLACNFSAAMEHQKLTQSHVKCGLNNTSLHVSSNVTTSNLSNIDFRINPTFAFPSNLPAVRPAVIGQPYNPGSDGYTMSNHPWAHSGKMGYCALPFNKNQ